LGKFFGKFEIGHFFCPFSKNEKNFPKKARLCDHILILPSGYQKNNAKFVTIIFFINFEKTDLGIFSLP
jgi:hypothetical protein